MKNNKSSKIPLIKIENLVKNYGKKEVLKGINFEINRGDRLAILAPNGGGKTTFIEIICKLRKITSGKITFLDGSQNFLRNVGVQFQIGSYPIGIRVRDLIYFYTNVYNTKVDKNLYRWFNIAEVKNQDFSDLSFGQQKRVELFLVLTSQVETIILDEITAGMDIYVKHNIINAIQKYLLNKNITLIYISHNLNEINQLCNRVVLIKDGKFIEIKDKIANLDLDKLMEKTYQWKK